MPESDLLGPRPPRRSRISWTLWVLLLAALPWAWFALRDWLGLVGDVLAIVLPVLVVLAVAVLLVVGRRRAALLAASVLLAGAIAVVAPWSPADAGSVPTPVTVASANITKLVGTVPALQAASADVLVVVENDPAVDAALAATYPHHLATTGLPAVGVHSRFPLRLVQSPGPDLPGLRVAVDAPAPFTLFALHVPRPWWTGRGSYQVTAAEHHRLVGAVAAQVSAEPGPVVVAGDLNSTDRGRDYRTLVDGAGLTDAMRAGWAGPTSVTTWRLLLLRIDHLLLSPGWCADAPSRFTLPGSDHDGITATVGPCGPTG